MNRSAEQTNRPRTASRFTRFVCPALRFIPPWTQKKRHSFLKWIDKGHVVINSVKNIWFFIMANSRNVDLTRKQHSRHQQFWRFPLSPLEPSSRLPMSRDHLFSHSLSKASLPQGLNMWYLTFYVNKVPIYQTPISNSLSHAGYSEARNGAQYKERWYTTQRQHQRRDVLMPSYKHIRRCINQGCTYSPRT